MTLHEAVAAVSSFIGQDFDAGKIRSFVLQLEMRAKKEIFSASSEDASDEYKDDTKLCIPAPYDMAYVYYSAARVNFERQEFELYNNCYERAEELYSTFARAHHRGTSAANRIRGLW